MFFILSKTLNYLTMPIVIICLLFGISFLLRSTRWKKRAMVLAFILLLFITNDFIANEFARMWEIRGTEFAEIKKPYDWAIVLTGVTKSDSYPEDRVHFSRGADRAIHAVYLYKKGLVKNILVSGGDGNLLEARRKEADLIKEALMWMGVAERDIVTENISRNTNESALEVKKIISADTLQGPFLLITSGYHMRRSLGCFKKVGIEVHPFSTDFISHKRKLTPDSTLIPRADALLVWTILIREYVGTLMYWITGRI